jgi:hypothetical protein
MSHKTIIKVIFVLSWAARVCWASGCTEDPQAPPQEKAAVEPVDAVLERLNKTTSELKSYEAEIEYKFTQPLLQSESLNKGVLYYARSGGTAAMRVNFNTRKQEDEKEQKYVEQYIVLDGARLPHPGQQLKGIWLVHLDYQIEEVKYYQLAEPNDPNTSADIFDLASRNLPMLGFSKTEDLKKEFEVTLVEPEKGKPEDFIQVHLKVKPNSIYKDDYVSIDFWIDEKSGLPARVVAVKTEPEPPFGDIQEIKFLKPKVNKGVDKTAFEFKIPKGFGEPEITPLQKKNSQQ